MRQMRVDGMTPSVSERLGDRLCKGLWRQSSEKPSEEYWPKLKE